MLVFIHINKTAGRTVRYILRSSYGLRHCEVEPWHASWTDPPFSTHDLQRLRRFYPNLESIGGHLTDCKRSQRSDFACSPSGSKQYSVLLTFGLKNSRPLAARGVVQARGAKPRLCQRILPVFKSRAYRPLVLTA